MILTYLLTAKVWGLSFLEHGAESDTCRRRLPSI